MESKLISTKLMNILLFDNHEIDSYKEFKIFCEHFYEFHTMNRQNIQYYQYYKEIITKFLNILLSEGEFMTLVDIIMTSKKQISYNQVYFKNEYLVNDLLKRNVSTPVIDFFGYRLNSFIGISIDILNQEKISRKDYEKLKDLFYANFIQ